MYYKAMFADNNIYIFLKVQNLHLFLTKVQNLH